MQKKKKSDKSDQNEAGGDVKQSSFFMQALHRNATRKFEMYSLYITKFSSKTFYPFMPDKPQIMGKLNHRQTLPE